MFNQISHRKNRLEVMFFVGGNKTSMKSCQVRSLVIYLAKLDEYFTNLDFPEIRGFPFLSDLSGEIGRVRSL